MEMRFETWREVENWRISRFPRMSRAALARYIGLSDSTITKGLQLNSTLQPSTATLVNQRLDQLVRERAS